VIARSSALVAGLAAAVAVAIVARLLSSVLPAALSEVLVAVLLGILVANGGLLPAGAAPGLRFAVQRVLRLGIILLGARLSLGDVAQTGVGALGLVLAMMTVAFSFAILAGRIAALPRRDHHALRHARGVPVSARRPRPRARESGLRRLGGSGGERHEPGCRGERRLLAGGAGRRHRREARAQHAHGAA